MFLSAGDEAGGTRARSPFHMLALRSLILPSPHVAWSLVSHFLTKIETNIMSTNEKCISVHYNRILLLFYKIS